MRAVLLVCGLVVCGCLPDAPFKQRGPTAPAVLDDGWPVATPEQVGLDGAALERIHAELLRPDVHLGTRGLLVIKDGRLVFETYLRDAADRDRPQPIQSATKSVTALGLGVAWDRGLVPSLQARLDALLPEAVAGLGEQKAGITLEHLLTMRSGLDFGNDTFSLEMLVDAPAQPLRHILEKPLLAPPGERFVYRDADPHLVGYVLQRLTGQSQEAWTRQHLFAPLGITDLFWVQAPDGTNTGAFGLYLRPRDLAKLGQLVLDRGRWQGQQVVSERWLQEATRAHVATERAPQGTGYGYYFWVLPEGRGVAAWGHGGQFVLVVPERNLVLVQVAMPDAQLHGSSLEDFLVLVQPLL